jgi:hypothetical protein
MAFTKDFKIYQIYHIWIFPSTILLYLPSSPYREIFSTGNIFFKFMYTVLVPYSSSYTLSPPPPPLINPLLSVPTGRTDPSSCSLILQKKGKMNNIIVCLRWLHREFPCSTSMYLCIFTWFSSFPLSFSFYFSPFFIVSPV